MPSVSKVVFRSPGFARVFVAMHKDASAASQREIEAQKARRGAFMESFLCQLDDGSKE